MVVGVPHPPPSLVASDVASLLASPLLEPLLLPELLPEDEPEELPDELPLLLPELLVVPPSSPELDDEVHAGSAETSANPAILTITADQANLFMCFSQSPLSWSAPCGRSVQGPMSGAE
jgi:hypothetical protein